MSIEVFKHMLSRFFSDEEFDFSNREILSEITGAMVQGSILQKKTSKELIDIYTKIKGV